MPVTAVCLPGRDAPLDLAQIACVLRPASVAVADQALRSFAAFLAEAARPAASKP